MSEDDVGVKQNIMSRYKNLLKMDRWLMLKMKQIFYWWVKMVLEGEADFLWVTEESDSFYFLMV